MNKVKGSGTLILKKIVRDRGPAMEAKLLELLDQENIDVWKADTLAVSWNPLPLEAKGSVLYEAALVLFPGDSNRALRELGRIMAKEGLPWFYQIFIRIPTPQFVWKRVAVLWRSFYDSGDASVENTGPKQMTFVLSNYPEYPPYMREYLSGYFLGVGELLHLPNMKVQKDESNPLTWRWHLRWD
ncbi:MAG: hypothetical protein AB1439_00955 [candidate division FCPU426 bacterium]